MRARRYAHGDNARRRQTAVPDDRELPATFRGRSRSDQLGTARQAPRVAACAPPYGQTRSVGPARGRPPRSVLGDRVGRCASVRALDERLGVGVHGDPGRGHVGRVGVDRLVARRTGRRTDPSRTARTRWWAASGQRARALAQPERVLRRVHRQLGQFAATRTARGTRYRPASKPTDDRQPRKRLAGELEVDGRARGIATVGCSAACARRSAAAPVPPPRARRAHDRPDRLRQPDHLRHPRAHLGGGEVRADPGADVLALADVQRLPAAVEEQINAGGMGQRLGEMSLGPLRGRHPRRERRQLLQGLDAEATDALEQPMQDVDRGTGVGESAMDRCRRGAEQLRERRQPTIGCFVAGDDAAGQPGRIDDGEPRPVTAPIAAQAALRKATSYGALWATRTLPRRTRETRGPRNRGGGAEPTMPSVMPVSTAMNAGIAASGLTSVWNSPSTSPPRTFTRPISVMRAVSGASPVVSRSTTTNVVSRSGVPSSSNVPWMPCPASWASPYPVAALMAGR